MTLFQKPPAWFVTLILAIGILAISTSAILVRLAHEAAGPQSPGFNLVLAGSRLTIAALILLPAWRQIQPQTLQPAALQSAVGAGFCLAVHFAAWISSLSYTSIAASTALVTTNPIWVTVLCWLKYGEKPSRLSAIGIGIALLGGTAIGVADLGRGDAGSHPLLGDFLALAGSWMVSLYLLLGREAQQRGLGIGGYSVMAYSTAAVILLPVPLAVGATYTGYPAGVYLYILLMAIVPQLIGHTSFNWSMLWISPTLVTLAILFEPLGASLLGYLLFQEVPGPAVILGALILLSGVAVAALGTKAGNGA